MRLDASRPLWVGVFADDVARARDFLPLWSWQLNIPSANNPASTPSDDLGPADPLALAKLGTGTVEKDRRSKKK